MARVTADIFVFAMACGGVPRGGPHALFWVLLFLERGGPTPDVVPQDPRRGGVGVGTYPPWVLGSGTPPGGTLDACFAIYL